jgi:hypothetical protein
MACEVEFTGLGPFVELFGHAIAVSQARASLFEGSVEAPMQRHGPLHFARHFVAIANAKSSLGSDGDNHAGTQNVSSSIGGLSLNRIS